MEFSTVIIGASHSGIALAAKLRELNYRGSIAIIDKDYNFPYQRPPLSKKYLTGTSTDEDILIRSKRWYDDSNISMIFGVSVTDIEHRTHYINLSDGKKIAYGRLALTTGGNAHHLSPEIGGRLKNVYTLRNKSDSDSLKQALSSNKQCIIVGGGYIGLEFAAAARKMNVDVTIVERSERILSRVASQHTSSYFRNLHQKHGVKIIEGVNVSRLVGKGGYLIGAELENGTWLEGDMAVVSIGISPNDGLARRAGLNVENGIIVNSFCETSSDDIVAAGDCARFLWKGEWIRLESVQNAVAQAQQAAATIMGRRHPYEPQPWFWSDQYDVKLQIAGISTGYTECYIRPGKRDNSKSIWYYRNGKIIAVDAINDPSAYVLAKLILERNVSFSPNEILNPEFSIQNNLR